MANHKTSGPRPVPPPQGSAYSRFIPREELQGFASWTPDPFGAHAHAAAQAAAQSAAKAEASAADSAPAGPSQEDMDAAVAAAHAAGYEDGYRDGLVALDSFKQSFAQQLSAQLGALVATFGTEFDALERDIAASVARVATTLARQVVRSELATRPELVVKVAAEAVNAVLLSANRIVVHVNPQDHALVAQGAADALTARGARLMADMAVQRGGCRVDSDAGVVDARIETRWTQVAQSLGADMPWDGEPDLAVDEEGA
ncbi:flagellar biosynthesis/type III secretory pathway protein [Burkholderiales bacterium JOSHI_001]|nr:flagellar biosynthesis/type III secretory pathway protein [Burkholderiales bacterium JOSHI_001]